MSLKFGNAHRFKTKSTSSNNIVVCYPFTDNPKPRDLNFAKKKMM